MNQTLDLSVKSNVNMAPDIKWESLKLNAIEKANEWSREKAKEKNKILLALGKKVDGLRKEIDNLNLEIDLYEIDEYDSVKLEYEKELEIKTQGVMFWSNVMKCSRFYCYFNLESITKTSCRVVQFILCLDVTSTSFQKLVFFKQNIILLIYKFTWL